MIFLVMSPIMNFPAGAVTRRRLSAHTALSCNRRCFHTIYALFDYFEKR